MHNLWYSAWCSFWEMRELCVYGNPRSNERMWFGGLIPFSLTQDTNVTGHQAGFGIYFINGWVPSNLSWNRDINILWANCPGERRSDLKPNGITYSKFIFRCWYVLEKIWVCQADPEWLSGQLQSPAPAGHTHLQQVRKVVLQRQWVVVSRGF